MNNKKIISGLLAAAIMLSFASCGQIDTQEQVNMKYSVEAVNVTKVSDIDGVFFYVPDTFLDQGTINSSNAFYSLTGDNFIIKINSLTTEFNNIDDLATLSDLLSNQFGEQITAEKVVSNETGDIKIKCNVMLNNTPVNGYIRFYNNKYAFLATCEDERTALKTVESMKNKGTKIQASKVENVKLKNDNLSASVNGLNIGESASIDRIQNDFSSMGANFEQMKSDLSYVNGASISDINKKVVMQFNAINEAGKTAHQAYLNSVAAYADAVEKYNVSLSNGVSFASKKAEIEAAFGLDLSPEWERIVIENESNTSSIKSLIIQYSNERDRVEAIIINKREGMEDYTLPEVTIDTEHMDHNGFEEHETWKLPPLDVNPDDFKTNSINMEETDRNFSFSDRTAEREMDRSLPEVNTDHSLPDVDVNKELPDVNVNQELPDVKIDQSLPDIKVNTSLPDVEIKDSLPDVNIKTTLPDVNIASSLPDNSLPEAKLDKSEYEKRKEEMEKKSSEHKFPEIDTSLPDANIPDSLPNKSPELSLVTNEKIASKFNANK